MTISIAGASVETAAGRSIPGLAERTSNSQSRSSHDEAHNYHSGRLVRNEGRYLNVAAVAQRYDCSVASIWRWVQNTRKGLQEVPFPLPVKRHMRHARWVVAELDTYDLAVIAHRDRSKYTK